MLAASVTYTWLMQSAGIATFTSSKFPKFIMLKRSWFIFITKFFNQRPFFYNYFETRNQAHPHPNFHCSQHLVIFETLTCYNFLFITLAILLYGATVSRQKRPCYLRRNHFFLQKCLKSIRHELKAKQRDGYIQCSPDMQGDFCDDFHANNVKISAPHQKGIRCPQDRCRPRSRKSSATGPSTAVTQGGK